MLCQLLIEGVSRTTQQLIDDRTSKDWDPEKLHIPGATEKCGLKHLNLLDKSTQKKVLTNYTKIIVVRHPIDKIISLYYNMLYVPPDDPTATCEFCQIWGKQIMKAKKNATELELSTGRGVSLTEFMEYATDIKHHQNDHYKEQYKLCNPCNVNYDYILKTETMKEDAVKIISGVFNSSLPFILSNSTKKKRKVPPYGSLKTKLLERYQRDLDMFGYKWHDP